MQDKVYLYHNCALICIITSLDIITGLLQFYIIGKKDLGNNLHILAMIFASSGICVVLQDLEEQHNIMHTNTCLIYTSIFHNFTCINNRFFQFNIF